MREAIDLINEIKKIHPSSRVLFTTYKYTQSFFEKYVFSHFRGKSLPLVLVDYHEYQKALRESGKSTLAGTRYLIDSVLVPGKTFHPKTIVACSEKEVKIIVSSANLTYAGFSKNAEISSVETIPFEKRYEYPILFDVSDFLSNLGEYIDSKPHRKALDGLLEKIDIKSNLSNVETPQDRLLHNLKEAIIDQVRELIQDKVTKVTVISPFFSQEISIYDKIANDFTENIEFIVQTGSNNFPVGILENWRHNSQVRFYSVAFRVNRYLHGKTLLFFTDSEAFALTGSANFTESALLCPTGKGGNIEASLFKRAKLGYFKYLFNPDMLKLQPINLMEVKPVNETSIIPTVSDFRILEAGVVDDKLEISIDYKLVDPLKVKVNIDNLEREIIVEADSNTISIPLSSDNMQALTASSIVSLLLEDGERKLSSDLRLIHTPLYFPEQFSVLNTIVDEDEKTWLFKILSRYASLPSLNYVLPIIERLEDYGFFESDRIRREEILWELQSRLGSIKPYSASEQIAQLINRFKQKHEKRVKNAIDSKNINQLKTILRSFVMINKLILWLVRKGHQDIHYLRFIKKNIDDFVNSNYIDFENSNNMQMLVENKLLAYLVMFSYTVDYLQRESPEFRKIVSPNGRNYLKEAFEMTFITAIQKLRKLMEEQIESDLEGISNEFSFFSPKIDVSTSKVICRLNEMIRNVNVHKNSSIASFSN